MDISENAAIHGFLRPDRSAIAPKIGAVNAISRPPPRPYYPIVQYHLWHQRQWSVENKQQKQRSVLLQKMRCWPNKHGPGPHSL